MTEVTPTCDPRAETAQPGARARTATLLVGMVVFALAVLVGFPALKGEFVGGDDHRLVLNHVLVNQPSIRHAIELFTIVHRDLYQPLPLLTFQLEFVVAGWFDLFADGVERGAWLFHFDNMWLHGVNALLVGAVLTMMTRRRVAEGEAGYAFLAVGAESQTAAQAVAWTGALLFAVHPLQVEVIAWINGRMMLLSTMFALCAMLAFGRWLERKSGAAAVLTVLFVVLSAISKVRVGLTVLLFLVPLAQKRKLDGRFWLVWSICTVLVGGFAILNLWTTAEANFFAGGAEHLQGPTPVRVLLALASYFDHFVWPVGLSSYYPAPPRVAWGDPATVGAIGTVLVALAILGWFSIKSVICRLGAVWFLAGIMDTLPFFPARNVLAADRYMYLPIIGLVWVVGALGYALYRRWAGRRSASEPAAAAAIAAIVVIPLLVAIGWRVAESYTTAHAQALRIATLFPREPRVWERLGWTYYRRGEYDKAIAAGERELVHDEPDIQSGAHQLIAMAEFKLGNHSIAFDLLTRTIEQDPESGLPYFRMATVHEELGNFEQAMRFYQRAVALAPQDTPTIRRLARVYRRLDRIEDARSMYRKALENNRHDVEAVIGLAELAIETGTADAYEAAEAELTRLLQDVPSDSRLSGNLEMIRLLRASSDENLRLASQAFIALSDGRYSTAAERVERLCADAAAEPARKWLIAQLERHDQERQGDPWTFGLSARLLLADGHRDAADMALGILDAFCKEDGCREYGRKLRGMIPDQEPSLP